MFSLFSFISDFLEIHFRTTVFVAQEIYRFYSRFMQLISSCLYHGIFVNKVYKLFLQWTECMFFCINILTPTEFIYIIYKIYVWRKSYIHFLFGSFNSRCFFVNDATNLWQNNTISWGYSTFLLSSECFASFISTLVIDGNLVNFWLLHLEIFLWWLDFY